MIPAEHFTFSGFWVHLALLWAQHSEHFAISRHLAALCWQKGHYRLAGEMGQISQLRDFSTTKVIKLKQWDLLINEVQMLTWGFGDSADRG